MKILICGGRDFSNLKFFWDTMNSISEKYDFDNNQPITIITGLARGADQMGKQYADYCSWDFKGFAADWKLYGKLLVILEINKC